MPASLLVSSSFSPSLRTDDRIGSRVREIRTESVWGADHICVHEPGAGVLAPDAGHRRLEQLVVVAGMVVESLEAPDLIVVVLDGAQVQSEVQREAADRQHARHHHLRRAQPDQRLHSSPRHQFFFPMINTRSSDNLLPPRRLRSCRRSVAPRF
jgi:hypothetical protein